MTILTSLTGSDQKGGNEKKLGAYVMTNSVPTPTDSESSAGTVPNTNVQSALRGRRILAGVCLSVLVLWLVLAAVLAGLLTYRYMHAHRQYSGWCGTSFFEKKHGRGQTNEPRAARMLQEQVLIDPDQNWEQITVPQFGINRPATFIHDFRKELTVIVDELGGQCFVKRLDKEHVSPPKDFIDLVEKMQNGYYGRSASVVHEQYLVAHGLSEGAVRALGSPLITSHCIHKQTYTLRKRTKRDHKRERRAAHKRDCLTFAVMNQEDTVQRMAICK